MGKRTNTGKGLCSDKTRLAIYRQDGFRCAYCRLHLLDGIKLTLDHIIADANGGGDEISNLITCCSTCNSRRRALTIPHWLMRLECEFGISPQAISWISRRLAAVPSKRAKLRTV